MPRYEYDEDIFKDSTMTFGEHLEELRRCLFRALVGLMVGFLVGLAIGRHVVEFIQTPLRSALEGYYEQKALEDAQRRWEEFQNQGLPMPSDLEMVKKRVIEEHLLPEEVYVDRQELLRAFGEGWPKAKQVLKEVLSRDSPGGSSTPQEPSGEKINRDGSERTDAGFGQASAVGQAETLPMDSSTEEQPADAARQNLVRMFLWRRVAEDPRVQIKSFNVQEGFLIYVKASLLTGAILASPWIFYQLWIFVAAGLYPHEKRYVHVFLPISLILFLAGVALAFFFVFPPVLSFLFSFNGWLGIDPDPRISEWLSFVLFLPLGFGIAFQLPLVMLFLERIGIFTVESYLSSWRVSVLVIFIISMIFTPADPYSMFLMAIPLLFLYVLGILMCKYMPRRWNPFE
ncbi:MAG: twin-arginine translocase subunit TatC [Thermoguttaceae bacterium]|nr:twin-arginine translocase subunit TatC [Thermoguttaceae bacterium]MDW8039412.1 twin-arginine translocase subunit TatC [Thermoguttaceae bacterium]